ncbi:MAG: PRC-barrel domain-containing protein [Candidatus Pacearchaeota archaeon]|nr:PRC-barrel domain-containing protein [Candidatus Pacearchaeota archaeon]
MELQKINLCLILLVVNLILLIQPVYAISANSDSYLVGSFGGGVVSGGFSSESYDGIMLSEVKGTTRNAESNSLLANIGFFEKISHKKTVNIISYSISKKKVIIGYSVGLYISALNAQSVWAKIEFPNKERQIINLVNGETINYLPTPTIIGKYKVIFYANSSAGDVVSVVDYFEVIEKEEQSSGGGSSGGGETKTIVEIKECSYNWECTPWSTCFNGKQIRTCKNTGTCKGNESKPIEIMQCSEALFDVILRMDKINISEKGKIRFVVDLIEKKGSEKIDVHIKYSLINSSEYEVFSQIETIALEKNLSYEKEIEMNLNDGLYVLRIDVLYGNLQRAFAERKIEIGWDEKLQIRDIHGFSYIDNISKKINHKKGCLAIIIFALMIVIMYLISNWENIKTKLMRMQNKKFNANRVIGLINKKVYDSSGVYIGKVKEVFLEKNKIGSLKILVDKKHNLNIAGIISKWKDVVAIKEIVIISDKILNEIKNK